MAKLYEQSKDADFMLGWEPGTDDGYIITVFTDELEPGAVIRTQVKIRCDRQHLIALCEKFAQLRIAENRRLFQ